MLNRLLEDGRLSEVGIIVIDELHMVLSFMIFGSYDSTTKATFGFQFLFAFSVLVSLARIPSDGLHAYGLVTGWRSK